MAEKKEKTFEEKVTEILAEDLKFYLTEFGQREDLAEIAKKIGRLAKESFKDKK